MLKTGRDNVLSGLDLGLQGSRQLKWGRDLPSTTDRRGPSGTRLPRACELRAWRLLAIRMPNAWRHRRPGLGLRKGPSATDVGVQAMRLRARRKLKGEMTHTESGQTLEPGRNSAPGAAGKKKNLVSRRNKKSGVEGGGCSSPFTSIAPTKGSESLALLSASAFFFPLRWAGERRPPAPQQQLDVRRSPERDARGREGRGGGGGEGWGGERAGLASAGGGGGWAG